MPQTLKLDGLTGADSILAALTGAGVDQIFASPGSEWAPLWESLAKAEHTGAPAPGYSSVGHEELAVAMASGYAKSSGELPAVVIHTTVGALHAAMALRGAHHEQIPMVVFAGESVAFGEADGPDPGAQWLGHLTDLGGPAALVERCVKWSVRIPHPSLIPSTVARACQIAETSPPGPVFLSVPMEYLFADMRGGLTIPDRPTRPTGDDLALRECARRLLEAKRPVIVTEEGGRTPGGVELLVRLAEQIGARVVETRGSRFMNFPRAHPLHAGFDPGAVVAEGDQILLCGVLAPWHPSSTLVSEKTTLTVLRENPLRAEVPYWGFPVSHVIHGAVAQSLARIIEVIEEEGASSEAAGRIEEISSRNTHRRAAITERVGTDPPITPRLAAVALDAAIPADAIVVDETLTARRALLEHLDRLGPGSYFSGAIGGLGTALGTALGVKAANPERLVVCTIGEGSLGYEPALAALRATRDLELPLLIVVLDNAGYLSQKATLPKLFPEGHAVENDNYPGLHLPNTLDYDLLARAFGGHGETVRTPDDLAPALARAVSAATEARLSVIDIKMEPTESLSSRDD